jgi:thioredoxin reductase (NADPH)
MIENLLGFPDGISGSELATRATVQARRFGAELLLARPLTGVSADGPGYLAELSDGTLIRGRAVLFASGVEWRRLGVPAPARRHAKWRRYPAWMEVFSSAQIA